MANDSWKSVLLGDVHSPDSSVGLLSTRSDQAWCPRCSMGVYRYDLDFQLLLLRHSWLTFLDYPERSI